jgi:hypothetical protein
MDKSGINIPLEVCVRHQFVNKVLLSFLLGYSIMIEVCMTVNYSPNLFLRI